MTESTTKVHICSYLTEAAPRSGPLFTCDGASTDLCSAQTRVLSLASALHTHLGAQNGDRICTLARTTPQHLEALLAITAAGCIAAPLNWRWSPEEAGYAVDLINATVLIADSACLPLALSLAEICSNNIKALVILGHVDERVIDEAKRSSGSSVSILSAENLIRNNPAAADHRSLQFPPEDAAFIIFTSGTSGRPRAALITHTAMHFQCQAKLQCCGYSSSDVYLHSAALFHVGGLCSALAMMLAGASHIFLPAFSAKEAVQLIRQYNITCTIAVPTMISDILAVASIDSMGRQNSTSFSLLPPSTVLLPSVRYILVGAGGMNPNAINELAVLMPNATLASAYGMTEGCSSLTFNTLLHGGAAGSSRPQPLPIPPPAAGAQGAVYVGRPPPGIELGIFTEKLRNASFINTSSSTATVPDSIIHKEGAGEVVTRGPHLALRYWGDYDATSAHFLPSGWFRTGDLGVLHKSGDLWLVGRVKDTIKTGGENVAAAEVERALLHHPGVANVAVVGLPHERLGEIVAAAVVVQSGWEWRGARYQALLPGEPSSKSNNSIENSNKGGSSPSLPLRELDAAILQDHCREMNLSGFKLPRVVVTIDSLPINATGKVVKAQLKEQILHMQVDAAAAVPTHRSKL